MEKLPSLLVFAVASFTIMVGKAQALNPQCSSKGDLGTVDCIFSSRYIAPNWQWATCLTENYIQSVSKNRHVCADPTAVQCWYQCQLEVFHKDNGPVNKTCQCTPGATKPTAIASTQVTLPPECYSPRIGDCTWYRNCLEKLYPCSGTSESYAVDFGEKFCNLYGQRQGIFSRSGQLWIDQVRQCLQLKLVPLLRPFETVTCARIRREAFASHTPCYTDGTISVCDLTCLDFYRIVGTIYPAFIGGSSSFKYTFQQTREVMDKCIRLDGSKNQCVLLKVAKILFRVYGKISSIINDIAREIVATVTTALEWANKGLQWISDVSQQALKSTRQRRALNEPVTLNIQMFIMSKAAINSTNLSPNLTESQRNAPEEAVEQLSEAVRTMPLLQNIAVNINGSRVVAQAQSMTQCFDLQCNTTNPNITDVQPLPGVGGTTPPVQGGSPGYSVKDTVSFPIITFAVFSCIKLCGIVLAF